MAVVEQVLTGNITTSIRGQLIWERFSNGGMYSTAWSLMVFVACWWLKLAKTVNDVYHLYNKHQFPVIVMDIETERGVYACWSVCLPLSLHEQDECLPACLSVCLFIHVLILMLCAKLLLWFD